MTPTTHDHAAPPMLFDAGATLALLWRRRLLIAAVTVGAILAAVAYLATAQPTYVATASIFVDPRDVKTTNIDSVLPGIGSDSAAIASQVSVIAAPEQLRKVFVSLGLEFDPAYAAGGFLSSLFGFGTGDRGDMSFEKFRRSVTIAREGLTYVINVSVRSSDSEKAAQIANAIVDQYIAGASSERSTAAGDVNAALSDRIEGLQNDVIAAELAVEEFKERNGIFDSATGGTLQSQIDQLASQLISAQDELAQAQARHEQAVAAGSSPADLARLGDVSSSPQASALRDQYNERAATLASAEATFGPRHPNVIQAKAQLDIVADLLRREAGRLTLQLASDRDAAQGKVTQLQGDLDSLRQRASLSSVAQVELRQLQGRADAARAVLTDFLQRSQETSQIQGLPASQVQVISRASAPPEPVWPKPSLLLPLAGALGLMLGSGLALVLGERGPRRTTLPAPRRVLEAPSSPAGRRVPRWRVEANERPAPTVVATSIDEARREITASLDTRPVRSVRALANEVLARLPARRDPPYVVTFSSVGDAALVQDALASAVVGFVRIGARVLLATEETEYADPAHYDFVFADSRHELAEMADISVLVLPAGQQPRRALHPREIAFVVPPSAPAAANDWAEPYTVAS